MLDQTFCSSPWFHFRINPDGTYNTCRWSSHVRQEHSLHTHSLLQFHNSDVMKTTRKDLLEGKKLDQCSDCYYQETFGKVNGRQKQLLKSAISKYNFFETLRSSPHYSHFKYSNENTGLTTLNPVDLQIDLGNTCNSSCIMCNPFYSSQLQTKWKLLHKIEPSLFQQNNFTTSWTKDKNLVEKFIDYLCEIPNVKYLHFLGGETLFQEAFYKISEALIDKGLSKNIILGTTTNGTIFSDRLASIVKNYKEFHLGISIESVTPLNNYIRFPSNIDNVLSNINQFIHLRKQNSNLHLSLRITPNVFSIFEIDKLFVYMIENALVAESCNILSDPKQLRIELLPENLRDIIIQKLQTLIDYYELESSQVVNTRRNDLIPNVIANIVLEYYNFMCQYKVPDDAEQSRLDLVKFIKTYESIHNNSILDNLPEYENFLRSYGL